MWLKSWESVPFSYYRKTPERVVHPFIQQPSLLGGAVTNVLIDTGLRVDGAADSVAFPAGNRAAKADRKEMRFTEIMAVSGLQNVFGMEKPYTNLLIGPVGWSF